MSLVGMLTGTVPLKDIASGKYDTQLKTWLQQAAAWGHPFFLLLDPEMNGTWASYSPGKNGNTAADFVNMWRHFHDLAVQAGATNITWVWCPNVDPAGLYTPYSQLYPGDAYVDWTGFNGFNKDGKSSFSWLFGSSYNTLRQIAPTKPILISETGAEETVGNKASLDHRHVLDPAAQELPADQGCRLVQLALLPALQVVELRDRVQPDHPAGVQDRDRLHLLPGRRRPRQPATAHQNQPSVVGAPLLPVNRRGSPEEAAASSQWNAPL